MSVLNVMKVLDRVFPRSASYNNKVSNHYTSNQSTLKYISESTSPELKEVNVLRPHDYYWFKFVGESDIDSFHVTKDKASLKSEYGFSIYKGTIFGVSKLLHTRKQKLGGGVKASRLVRYATEDLQHLLYNIPESNLEILLNFVKGNVLPKNKVRLQKLPGSFSDTIIILPAGKHAPLEFTIGSPKALSEKRLPSRKVNTAQQKLVDFNQLEWRIFTSEYSLERKTKTGEVTFSIEKGNVFGIRLNGVSGNKDLPGRPLHAVVWFDGEKHNIYKPEYEHLINGSELNTVQFEGLLADYTPEIDNTTDTNSNNTDNNLPPDVEQPPVAETEPFIDTVEGNRDPQSFLYSGNKNLEVRPTSYIYPNDGAGSFIFRNGKHGEYKTSYRVTLHPKQIRSASSYASVEIKEMVSSSGAYRITKEFVVSQSDYSKLVATENTTPGVKKETNRILNTPPLAFQAFPYDDFKVSSPGTSKKITINKPCVIALEETWNSENWFKLTLYKVEDNRNLTEASKYFVDIGTKTAIDAATSLYWVSTPPVVTNPVVNAIPTPTELVYDFNKALVLDFGNESIFSAKKDSYIDPKDQNLKSVVTGMVEQNWIKAVLDSKRLSNLDVFVDIEATVKPVVLDENKKTNTVNISVDSHAKHMKEYGVDLSKYKNMFPETGNLAQLAQTSYESSLESDTKPEYSGFKFLADKARPAPLTNRQVKEELDNYKYTKYTTVKYYDNDKRKSVDKVEVKGFVDTQAIEQRKLDWHDKVESSYRNRLPFLLAGNRVMFFSITVDTDKFGKNRVLWAVAEQGPKNSLNIIRYLGIDGLLLNEGLSDKQLKTLGLINAPEKVVKQIVTLLEKDNIILDHLNNKKESDKWITLCNGKESDYKEENARMVRSSYYSGKQIRVDDTTGNIHPDDTKDVFSLYKRTTIGDVQKTSIKIGNVFKFDPISIRGDFYTKIGHSRIKTMTDSEIQTRYLAVTEKAPSKDGSISNNRINRFDPDSYYVLLDFYDGSSTAKDGTVSRVAQYSLCNMNLALARASKLGMDKFTSQSNAAGFCDLELKAVMQQILKVKSDTEQGLKKTKNPALDVKSYNNFSFRVNSSLLPLVIDPPAGIKAKSISIKPGDTFGILKYSDKLRKSFEDTVHKGTVGTIVYKEKLYNIDATKYEEIVYNSWKCLTYTRSDSFDIDGNNFIETDDVYGVNETENTIFIDNTIYTFHDKKYMKDLIKGSRVLEDGDLDNVSLDWDVAKEDSADSNTGVEELPLYIDMFIDTTSNNELLEYIKSGNDTHISLTSKVFLNRKLFDLLNEQG